MIHALRGRPTKLVPAVGLGAALLQAVVALVPLSAAGHGGAALTITAVDVIGLNVSDMDRVSPSTPACLGLAREHRLTLVSPGSVDAVSLALGFRTGALTRDPDAHGIRLVTR